MQYNEPRLLLVCRSSAQAFNRCWVFVVLCMNIAFWKTSLNLIPKSTHRSITMAPDGSPRIQEEHLQDCLRALEETRELCLQIIQQDRERSQTASASSTTVAPSTDRQRSQKALFASLSNLRGLHRNAYMQMRQTKQTTSEAKQEQDRLHLKLQNLYYEQRHLRGEIDSCLEFPYDSSYRWVRSMALDMDLQLTAWLV